MIVPLPSPSSIPQTTSAIAQTNIFPGAAVAQSADRAVLAGSGTLATHVANLGSTTKGIASLVSSGTVFLDNWTLATGARLLTTGVTYYAGPGGKLITTGGQPVGIATSPTTLSVTIQSQNSQSSASSSGIADLQSQINSFVANMASLVSNLNVVSASVPKIFSGTFAIGNATNTGTVTGIGLTFTPSRAIAVIRKQSGALNIFATVIDSTVTTDGFQFVLSSNTDSAAYLLDFIMAP